MRKSNWSDLLSALAMSARDKVRRLLESATMNARAVISAMKTFDGRISELGNGKAQGVESVLSQALQNRIGAVQDDKGYEEGRYTAVDRPSAAIIWEG